MMMDRDLTWGGGNTIQYTDDVLQNCTPKTYKKEKKKHQNYLFLKC